MKTNLCIQLRNERRRSPPLRSRQLGHPHPCIAREFRCGAHGAGELRTVDPHAAVGESIKYEEVYLHAYDSVSDAKAGIARYVSFYNARRPHSSLDGRTPDHVYFTSLPLIAAA